MAGTKPPYDPEIKEKKWKGPGFHSSLQGHILTRRPPTRPPPLHGSIMGWRPSMNTSLWGTFQIQTVAHSTVTKGFNDIQLPIPTPLFEGYLKLYPPTAPNLSLQ